MNTFSLELPEFADAACRQIGDPDLWFIDNPIAAQAVLPIVKQICGACPHQAECLQWAIDHNEIYGVWGGLTAKERMKLHKVKRVKVKRERRPNSMQAKAFEMREAGMEIWQIARHFNRSRESINVAISRERKARKR